LPEICSDHCVPCATVINNINTNYSFKRTLYNYEKLDSTKFCNMLSRIDWADAMQNGSIDDRAEHFNTIFFEAACNCMPVKTVTIRSKDAAWINADIRCVHSRVFNYLKVNNIIYSSQSGFMPGDSTVNQLTSIYHDLCTSFDQGITSQSIFY